MALRAGFVAAVLKPMSNSSRSLEVHGISHADAATAAYTRVYQQLHNQTLLLAFIDCFRIIGVMTLVVAPLVLLTKALKTGNKASAGY